MLSTLRVSKGWGGGNFSWVKVTTAKRYLCVVFVSLSVDGVGATTTLQGLGSNAHLHPWERGAHRTCKGKQH